MVQHFAAFFVVSVLSPLELDVDLHLVLVLQERASLLNFELNVVFAGLGPQANFLDLRLVCLGVVGVLFSYLNLPKSMMRQTGGRSFGLTSTKSRPASRAKFSASRVGITPCM